MNKYIIYRHTLNNKDYIGYSSQTIEERLEEHIKNSLVDKSDRHFHRAIRKYGAENITSVVLDVASTKSEAILKERQYIVELDTFKNGYNMTLGGDGGNTKEKYTEEEMAEWKKSFSERMSGMNNSNAKPDITADTIINFAVDYVVSNNLTGKNIIMKALSESMNSSLKISGKVVNNRGIKNSTELIARVNDVLTERNLPNVIYDPYYRSDEERKHLAKISGGFSWVTDGATNKKLKKGDIDGYLAENTTFRKGRTL